MGRCKRCGVDIPGDGSEWADWTDLCQECEWEAQYWDQYWDDDENDDPGLEYGEDTFE